jgi:NADPH:quinone reductase-like Zn-dependent oxidoreductase
VIIAVRAAGVGNWDELARTGAWDLGLSPPAFIGVEAAGVILQVGADVRDLAPGDQVLGHTLPLRGQGAWASLVAAPAVALARKPSGIDWNVAAAFSVPALTAEQALVDALALHAGECLLVHGSAGVTGGLIVQRAAGKGARVIATGVRRAPVGSIRTAQRPCSIGTTDTGPPKHARRPARKA